MADISHEPSSTSSTYGVSIVENDGPAKPRSNLASASVELSKTSFALAPSRHGDKYKAMFHNLTAMVGAGVLGLPATFVFLGWGGGAVSLIVFLGISWYTFYLLVQLHEVEPEAKGKPIRRLDTYLELCQHVLGPVRGFWSIVPFQTTVNYGLSVTYTVTGALNLRTFYRLNGGTGMDRISAWVCIFSAAELLLSLVPNFGELGWVSLMGAVMSGLYSVIAVVLSAMYPAAPNVSYSVGDKSSIDKFFGVFGSLSTVAFAFGGHNIAMEIQATLPAAASESTIKPMMFGVHAAFVMTSICYSAVSFVGFWAFGNGVPDNVLDAVSSPVSVISIAHLAVVLHVLASYQVYAFPLMESIERLFIKHTPSLEIEHKPKRRVAARITLRYLYVFSTAFIACLIPFFGDLMSLIGAIAITPNTFVLPCILWLVNKRPPRTSPVFLVNIMVIIIMSCVGVMGTVAAIKSISKNASTYKPFS